MYRTRIVLIDQPGSADRGRGHGMPCPYGEGDATGGHLRQQHVSGDAEMLAENLRGHAEEGISHVQVVLDANALSGVEAFERVLEVLDCP